MNPLIISALFGTMYIGITMFNAAEGVEQARSLNAAVQEWIDKHWVYFVVVGAIAAIWGSNL